MLTLKLALFSEEIFERRFEYSLEPDGREVFNGLFEERFSSNVLRIQGMYSKGKKTGLWKTWNDQGLLLSSESWLSGLPKGEHQLWHSNGNLISIVRYDQGLKSGRSETWYPNLQRKTRAEYSYNVLNGAYQEWHQNGREKIRCLYENGHIDGTWNEWDEQGALIAQRLYKKGAELKLLEYSEKYPTGTMKLAYRYYLSEQGEEIKHGPFNKWFPNGENWLKCEYHHDQLHGLWQYGKMEGLHCRQENYSFGKKDGRFVWYNQGKITREEFWKDGTQISQHFYDKTISGNEVPEN